jgi:hypothetical protein
MAAAVAFGGSWDQLTAAAGDSFAALLAGAAAAAAALAPTAADGHAEAVTTALLGRHHHSPSPAPPPPAPGGGGGGVLSLSPVAVALAAALIVVQALVSLRFSLGLHTQLAIAAARCVVQLSVLGYVLGESGLGYDDGDEGGIDGDGKGWRRPCKGCSCCDPHRPRDRGPVTIRTTQPQPTNQNTNQSPSLSTTSYGSYCCTAPSWSGCRRWRPSGGHPRRSGCGAGCCCTRSVCFSLALKLKLPPRKSPCLAPKSPSAPAPTHHPTAEKTHPRACSSTPSSSSAAAHHSLWRTRWWWSWGSSPGGSRSTSSRFWACE